MAAVDRFGMKSGIIKIVPPEEWKDSLPNIDDLIKQVRVREPIKQDIMGSNGTYRQVNILHQRSYNIPQWRQLCDQSEHQPPARRGERRANADKPKPVTRSKPAPAAKSSTPAAAASARRGRSAKRGRGGRGGGRGRGRRPIVQEDSDDEDRPITPELSPRPDDVVASVEQDPGVKDEDECEDPTPKRMNFSRQAKPKVQSTSARRKYSRREGSAMIDEESFKNFDYHMDISDYTPERCEELERTYWKTLTYATPLYGADLMGTLFDESTEHWNLNKLPNLLDVLGTKVPGVNTAYLYLGMWKATFAWHLEDVDLYSINYLHFGAPKQWYSISQADARRFENAMKSIWPTEAKACDQFLRHKAFLISPSHLLQHYNIKVNKCLSYPGEFVVTYPYGYHSGYNLGYNCAEAVNFALDSWLPMGKIAKKCECAEAQDSVWVDVYEIERKLRGEPTPEYWSSDEEDDEDEEDEDEDDEEDETGLPSPSSSHVRIKAPVTKRKRARVTKDKKEKGKKLRLRVKAYVEPPCCLCPNDIPGSEILSTDDGRKAHRLCALYLPETYIETVDGEERIFNLGGIEKARLELKCLFCRSKRGACFQCSQKKCPRSYHATCAAAAGVFVEEGDVPVFDKDGVEYKEQAFEFSCRFHRTKRGKQMDGNALDENPRIKEAATALQKGEICQMQYYRKEIFAGVIVENRHDEQTLLLDIVPNGYDADAVQYHEKRLPLTSYSSRVEVEWKWLLLPDPSDYHLPKASPHAVPMPSSRKAQQEINAKRSTEEPPRAGDMFVAGLEPGKDYNWFEFNTCEPAECKNGLQVKVDMSKMNQIWHYLGRTSTEAKAQYTEDPSNPKHNPKGNFLDSIPKPPPPPRPQVHHRASYGATHPVQAPDPATSKTEKPYVYKPRKPIDTSLFNSSALTTQNFTPNTQGSSSGGIPPLSFGTDPRFSSPGSSFAASRFSPLANSPQPQHAQQHVNTQFASLHSSRQPPPAINPAWLAGPQTKSPTGQTSQSAQPGPRPLPPFPTAGAARQGPPAPDSNVPVSRNPFSVQARNTAPQVPQQAAPQPAPQQVAPQYHWQKFKFFQSSHNRSVLTPRPTPAAQLGANTTCRDTSRYRTPYALWGGFTNGYEGDLRKHLMKKPDAVPFTNRRLSFNLGGGLQGLTRPPSHQYSNSASSSTSPYNGAGSPTSSHASAMSPPAYPARGTGHQRTSSVSTTPSHPAMRAQAGSSSSQMTYNTSQVEQDTSGLQTGASSSASAQGFPFTGTQSRSSMPPISPAGIPSQQPTFLNTSPHQATHGSLGPSPMDVDPETHESPAQQLKHQLRRISDPMVPSFRLPRSRSHTPRSSLNQLPRLRSPSQPDLHIQQEQRPSESQATTSSELAANGVAVREFPEPTAAADSQGLIEKMMFDLRRASMQSQGLEGSANGYGGSPASH